MDLQQLLRFFALAVVTLLVCPPIGPTSALPRHHQHHRHHHHRQKCGLASCTGHHMPHTLSRWGEVARKGFKGTDVGPWSFGRRRRRSVRV